jgi:proliferating cell nuclear antigen
MFKATLADVSLLREPLSSIAELIDEGIFKATGKGLSLVAADRAMVAVADFLLSSGAFEKYELDRDEAMGLNVTNLLSVIRRAGAGDKLSLNLQGAKLEIVIEGESRRRFVVPLLDLREEEEPPIDQLEFKSRVKLKPDVLQNGLSDAEIITDSVVFSTSPTRFAMMAEGDVSRTELELEKGNEALLELVSDGGKGAENVKSRYALDYLKKMVKAAKIADSVSIEYAQDYPMKLGFVAGDKVRLSFIVAPRVTEE